MRSGGMALFIVLLTALPAVSGEGCPPGGCGGCGVSANCEQTVDTVVQLPEPRLIMDGPFLPPGFVLPPTPSAAEIEQGRALFAAIDRAPDSVFLRSGAGGVKWIKRMGELWRDICDTRAFFYFRRATECDTASVAAWVGRAQTEEALGQLAAARASYERAVGLRPEDTAARYELALFLGRQGEAAGAAEQLRLVTQRDAQFAPAWFNLGVALTQLEDFSAAAAAYEQTLQLRPNYAPAWFNLGAVAARVERRELAYECYQQLLLLDAELAAKLYPRIGQ